MQPILDADLLRTFVAIADTGSFSVAAERAGRTPSAVSMQVKKLEDLVGRRLFDRDSRRVALTAFGESMLPDARRILQMHAELWGRLKQPDLEGSITVGTPDEYASAFLPRVLRSFARTHPRVQVNVICDISAKVRVYLERGDIDSGLVTNADISDAQFLRRQVHEEQLVWLGARGGTAYRREPLPVAVANPDCCWRKRSVAALNKAGFRHRVAYQSASAAGQIAAVAGDLAIAPLPASLARGDLVLLGADTGLPDLGTYAISFIARDENDPLVMALSDHVAESFAPASVPAPGMSLGKAA
ncbi:LysR substrate-binding domain-containing protein [Afifella sp. JA880]|uniref:LysR family transcriptional regulator n=1 Tax=Afifella sp. JA880 TaxID=2975280 RepID=UPI0021BA9B60|nr:LysR substrate-binding domain-containing protein [Afifella sp. JA880]MCT8268431.1 LysR substrate-binding domain-containing protein [Afifella sp. JA880]